MCEWCERYEDGDEEERERIRDEFLAAQPFMDELASWLRPRPLSEFFGLMRAKAWGAMPEDMREQADELANLPVIWPVELERAMNRHLDRANALDERANERDDQGMHDVADALDTIADARYALAEAVSAELRSN